MKSHYYPGYIWELRGSLSSLTLLSFYGVVLKMGFQCNIHTAQEFIVMVILVAV